MQFARLDEMLANWGMWGYDYDDIELWAVGYAGQESRVPDMAGETRTESIFVDSSEPTESAFTAYGAHGYDTFIIDAEGRLTAYFNVGINNITLEEHRTHLFHLVIGILEG